MTKNNTYIITLDIILKELIKTQGTLPYITWGLIWDTKNKGVSKTTGDPKSKDLFYNNIYAE